jgi:hypothetical protein
MTDKADAGYNALHASLMARLDRLGAVKGIA